MCPGQLPLSRHYNPFYPFIFYPMDTEVSLASGLTSSATVVVAATASLSASTDQGIFRTVNRTPPIRESRYRLPHRQSVQWRTCPEDVR